MQQWPGQQVSPAQQQPAQPTQQPTPQPVQRAPGIIRGAPAPVDPMEQERLRLQQEAAARAAQADARQQAAFEGTGGQGTEAQNKAAVLLGRIQGGFADIQDIIGTYPEAERPGLAETLSYGALGPESVIARQTTDWQRRAINDVQRDIVDALLTMGTGAAYNQEQLEAMRVSYFPQYGDTPDEIAYKRRRLQRMIDTARLQAGPNAARLDEALGPLMQSLRQPTEQRRPTARDEAPLGYETGFDRMGRDDVFDRAAALQETFGINPGKETRLVGMLNANRGNENFTVESLAQIYSDLGIPAPTPAQMEEMAQGVREGRTATGIDTSAMEREYTQGLDTALSQMGEDPTSNVGAAAYGAARGVTLGFSDEITGAGAAIGAALSGGDPGAAYTTYRDLTRRQLERTREESPVISYGSEIGGAIASGGVLGVPRSATQAARIGAIEGGVYGAGTAQDLQSTPGNALIGAVGGAGAGAALQPVINRASNALQQMGRRGQVENAQDLAEASTRTGVPLRRMDVDTSRQGQRAALLQDDRTRNVIRDADAEDVAAFEGAIARDLGDETDAFSAGQRIAEGAIQSRQNIRNRASRIYDRAHRQAGDVRIEPRQALAAIDQNIQELTEAGANANAAAIRYLQGVREDLAREGGLSIRALRNQRTGLRDSLKPQGLDRTDLERRMTQVLDAAGDDISQGLRGNPEALQSFRQADQLWREQAQFRDRILTQLVGRDGNRSPEQTARAVQSFVKQDFNRASRLMAALDDTDKAEVRNLIASSLGRNQRDEFSVSMFLKQTGGGRGSIIDERTQRLIFGEDGVRAIRDLRALAKVKEDTASLTNRSNTGGVVQRAGRGLRTAMLAGLGVSEAGITGGVAAPAAASFLSSLGNRRAARLLINPDFTRWLRTTPETSNPRAIDRHFARLRTIAQRTPGMTADVDALQRAIIGAVNDNSSARIAAEEQPQE